MTGTTVHARMETSYDALGRAECTALRMDPSDWGSGAANACAQDPTPSTAYGPDRIGRTIRNAVGETIEVQTAVGTPLQAAEATSSYSPNGRLLTLTDGENNRTTYEYDGHDRLRRTYFPSPTTDNVSSTTDYEELGYDAAGNVTARRNRAGETATYTLDALGRVTLKNLPGTEPDVTYAYDLLGRMLSASQTGHALSFTWDALGRNLTQVSPQGTIASQWDAAGRRTRITHPDTFYVAQDYLVTGEMTAIRENGATSGIGVLATFGYDDRGRRTSLTYGNGVVTGYDYDAVSRLETLTQDLANVTPNYDLTLGFAYNPASQIVTNTRSNTVYSFTPANGIVDSTPNGLNQIVTVGGTATTHDVRGNMTSEPVASGTRTYAYSSENLLVSSTYNGSTATLSYDPLTRLSYTSAGARFLHDGEKMVAEYLAGTLLRHRYVFGPGVNEPLVWYDHASTGTVRRFMHADERGSVAAITQENGTAWNIRSYDEYGQPGPYNAGRFQYNGQAWLPEVGLLYYRARMYNARLGRFMQTDPIGYGDGMNMYAYVVGDPVNRVDASGMSSCNMNTAESRICRWGHSGEPKRQSTYAELAQRFLEGLGGGLAGGAFSVTQTGDGLAGFASADARQLRSDHCEGNFQCAPTPTRELRNLINALGSNRTFRRSVAHIIRESIRTGNEWGFTGRGFADFRLIGGYIEGSRDFISGRIIAERARMGATIFFHTHPNIDRSGVYEPFLSTGVSNPLAGGDLGVACRNRMFIGAFSFQNAIRGQYPSHWFDARTICRD